MPILHLQVSRLPSPAATDALASHLTGLIGALLGKQREVTAVTVSELPARHWYIGGEPLSETAQASAFLDIKVTQGTNTKDQKAAFVEQAFAALRTALGPLAPASYVVVHELSADAWGYGGPTQEFRYVQRQLG